MRWPVSTLAAAALLSASVGCGGTEGRSVSLTPAESADAWWPEIVQCTQQPWLVWCRAECVAAGEREDPSPGWCS